MNAISLILIGMPADARSAAIEAAGLACPGAAVTDLASVEDACSRAPDGRAEILLLGSPEPTALAQAATAIDAVGRPRWAIVVFGEATADDARISAVLPREDWTVRLIAQVLKLVCREQALSRQNSRLHGDLSTIGRRISHDLRTSLTAIYNACEAIDEILAERTAEHKPFTESIAASTDELVKLIARVSLILKASAEPAPIETFAMGEVVFGTLQRLEREILKTKAVITQPPAWPAVTGVPPWLETIWLNLLTNALQNAGAAPAIELGWSQEPDRYRFWVADRGPGVPPERIGKLFQPFDRLHRLDAPRGLGLALVQRLVELQGGRCGYEPRHGGGACFFFTIPTAADSPASGFRP